MRHNINSLYQNHIKIPCFCQDVFEFYSKRIRLVFTTPFVASNITMIIMNSIARLFELPGITFKKRPIKADNLKESRRYTFTITIISIQAADDEKAFDRRFISH